jgi:hypothetical protein
MHPAAIKVEPVDHRVSVFRQRLLIRTGKREWQPNPKSRRNLIPKPQPQGVALILRIGNMAPSVATSRWWPVTLESARRNRKLDISHDVGGVTGEPRKSSPFRQLQLRFRAVDNAFPEGNRKADRGPQKLGGGGVVEIASQLIGIQPYLSEQTLRRAHLVIVPVRRFDRRRCHGEPGLLEPHPIQPEWQALRD